MLRATVVIPTMNRADDLGLCLAALAAQSLPRSSFEVIVVDDGSTDATAEVIAQFESGMGSNVRGIRQANRGPAAARNAGVEQALADLVAFTDDDCRPSLKWLEELLAALPGDPRCAGVGGPVVRCRDGLVGRFIDHVGMLAHATRLGEVLYLVTANALFRTSAVRQVGGFDARFAGPGGEDPDLGDRLRAGGYTLARTDRAAVGHNHRDTIRGLFDTYRRYGRGEAVRVRLGRKSGLWYQSHATFLAACVMHWAIDAARVVLSPRLRLRDRLAFPVLRAIANAGSFVGYVTGPRSAAARPATISA